jgi:hypothetical protein
MFLGSFRLSPKQLVELAERLGDRRAQPLMPGAQGFFGLGWLCRGLLDPSQSGFNAIERYFD